MVGTAYERFAGHVARVFMLVLLSTATSQTLEIAARPAPKAVALSSPTIEAFNHYIRLTDARSNAELQQVTHFLWIDALEESARKDAYLALQQGQIEIKRLETREERSRIHCPNGLIHHWAGIVYIPNTTLTDVLSV